MRELAKKLIGEENEAALFDRSDADSYNQAVRRVLSGWSIEHALMDIKVPKHKVAEGELICKCGSRRVQSHVLQTRSCDEAGKFLHLLFKRLNLSHPPQASIFARCSECGNAWRM